MTLKSEEIAQNADLVAPSILPVCQVWDLGTIRYAQGLAIQREIVEKRKQGIVPDSLFLLEHHHVITLGRSGKRDHLVARKSELEKKGIDYFLTDRGGDITYHGPGQLVAYPIMDLKNWHRDIHLFLRSLEGCVIQLLGEFGLQGYRVQGATGVWVNEQKIAAIGIRTSQWISSHGLALNVNTDLNYFNLIVPCGIRDKEVTSLARELGRCFPMLELKDAFCRHFGLVFGRKMVWRLEPIPLAF